MGNGGWARGASVTALCRRRAFLLHLDSMASTALPATLLLVYVAVGEHMSAGDKRLCCWALKGQFALGVVSMRWSLVVC